MGSGLLSVVSFQLHRTGDLFLAPLESVRTIDSYGLRLNGLQSPFNPSGCEEEKNGFRAWSWQIGGVPICQRNKRNPYQTRPTSRSHMTARAIFDDAPQVGMEARLFRGGSVQTVRMAIRNGLPLIVLQMHVSAGRKIPHWRVASGFDDERRLVYIMDPLLGYVTMPYAEFERVWADHQGTFAVLYPLALREVARRTIG
ncbi:C39 family peptidase [Deinococcus sp. 12RED42]|uniref:C39 family peptidase n=1 Tax=Deinococcus sp. 12RED42 TaxID=2745872 RepID=UPI00351D28AB